MNGQIKILKELQKIAESGELPARVTNRLVLAGVIQLTETITNGRYEKRIAVLEKVVAILTTLVIVLIGFMAKIVLP